MLYFDVITAQFWPIVCAIFIDGKPVAHGRAEMVGIAQPEALCGRDKFHSDRQEIKTGFVRS